MLLPPIPLPSRPPRPSCSGRARQRAQARPRHTSPNKYLIAHGRCSFCPIADSAPSSFPSDAILQPSRYEQVFTLVSTQFTLSLAWQYPRPPHHPTSLDVPPPQFTPLPPRTRHTSTSGPSPYMPETTIHTPLSSIPPSLTPGRQRARIWDKSATQRPHTSHDLMTSPYQSSRRPSLYGDYFSLQPQASLPPPPPLPQKPQALLKPLTNPLPPIPPKPPALALVPASRIPLYPTSIPLPMVGPSSQSPEPSVSETVPPLNKEIDLALTLSASEARKREQELIDQEEEELARALEESRLLSNSVYSLDEQLPSSPSSPRSSSVDRASTSAIKASLRPPEGESWLHMITPTASTSSQYSSLNEDFSSSHSSLNQNGSDDDPNVLSGGTPNDIQNSLVSRDTLSPTPPLYANIVSNLVRSPLPAPSPSHSTVTPSSSSATPTAYLQSDYPSSDRVPSSPSLSQTHTSSSEQSPMPSFASRPSWSSVSSENSMSAGRSLGSELLPASSGYRSPTPASPDLSLGPSANLDPLNEGAEKEADTEPGPSTRPVVPLSANQYVEREMLMGVCMSQFQSPSGTFFDMVV